MVVEELIAKLGWRISGSSEAQKFIRELDRMKRSLKDLSKGFRVNLSGNSAISQTARQFELLALNARRARQEMERLSRVRYPRGGFGGSFMPPGYHPGRRPGSRRSGGNFVPGTGGEFVSGLGAGAFAARAGLTGAGALGAGLLAAKSTKTAMDFQRAMIDVVKATDATPEQRAGYEKSLFDLSRRTGRSKEDLAQMLAAGGFAGRPTDELMRFTEYGAKASLAWGVSAEETGQALAEIGNIYGAKQGRIEEIGDAIDTIADKTASRESDLLEFMRRAGASGKLSGISAENMLALGAAQKEVGIRTDTAATATEALLNILRLGEEFSKGAGDGLKQLGFNSDKLRKDFFKKPIETLITFLEAFEKITDPMKRAEAMVNTMGKEYQDDVGKMLNALPRMREILALSNDPSKMRGSVSKSFDRRLEEEVTKVDQASASLSVLGNRLGDAVLKNFLGPLAEATNRAIDELEGTPRKFTDADKAATAKLLRDFGSAPGKGDADDWNWWAAGSKANVPWASPPRKPLTPGQFGANYGKSPFGSLTDRMKWGGAGKMPGHIDPGALQNRFGADWMRQGLQQTTNNITNNENTGNDQRTQSVHISQTINGIPGVASAAAEGAKSGLSSLGASIAKSSSTPTGTQTAP